MIEFPFRKTKPPEPLKHPYEFKKGVVVESWPHREFYEVIEPNKKGMAKFKNLDTGGMHDFNSTCNQFFIYAKGRQRELFT